ncbi:class I SAM-dependent methyltransferase [Pseudophaeobacter arcticus]|uniref:Class I SAM-dependent methyltransferase n=1 Tax=Pseudophaeobacter arcticus TaxID=385492 RepID=A0ABQ0AJN1_9RHOB
MGQGAYHWDRIYEARKTESVSWFQSDPRPSLRAIALCGGQALSIIDIGGGSSRLAGALMEQRRHDVTVLDLSKRVLTLARVRLGADRRKVAWIAKDVTRWQPHRQWDIWHDRAVFRFLTEDQDRQAYLQALGAAVPHKGHVVLAGCAPDGLQSQLGESYDLLHSWVEAHGTPTGQAQAFTWCVFQKL